MADHTTNSMAGALRSMREVVIPAIDPAHPLALEQAQLVAKYIEFWMQRIDHVASRNLLELESYLGLADDLLLQSERVSPFLHGELLAAAELGRAVARESPTEVVRVRRAAQDLARVITALVRTAAELDQLEGSEMERLVVARARDLLLMQRSWFLPQGWEENPPPPPYEQVVHDQLRARSEEKKASPA